MKAEPDDPGSLSNPVEPLSDDSSVAPAVDATIDQHGDLSATIIAEFTATLDMDADPERTLKAQQDIADCQTAVQQSVVLKRRQVMQQDSETDDADYQINELLGEGGMGSVYAARQQSMDRPVAIKVLKSQVEGQDGRQDAFVSEAIITGGLDHPNIVPIYEVGKQSNDAPFYAMKQVIGVEWSARFGSNSVGENLEILLRVSDAIAFAHARGIIHRDLKPANIMLGAFGEVLVMDWGLAMPLQDHPRRDSFPVSEAAGTPNYMAPEMLNDVTKIDRRSDVYLLGGILFKIVTGTAPHKLESPPAGKRERVMAVLEAVAANRIASTDKSGELLDIARKAIATDPADRYQTVPEFQTAVREYLSHEESIELADRAAERLAAGRQSGEYTEFSRARFGFETALEEWPENDRAAKGLKETRFDYAKTAFDRRDFDLALSLIDASDATQKELGASIQQAIVDRDARQQQLRRMRRITLAASLTVAVIAIGAAMWINSERGKALVAQQDEAAQRVIAQDNFRIAEQNGYYSDIQLLRQSWNEATLGQFESLLNLYRDREDLRGLEWDYWDRLAHTELFSFECHSEVAHRIDFSPDGTRLAFAGSDQTVTIIDTVTGQETVSLSGHTDYVLSVSFSPDGLRVASSCKDKAVKVWDVLQERELLTLNGHSESVQDVSYSPDGTQLASASWDKTAKIWDAATGENTHTLTGHKKPVSSVAFSPDGTQLATYGFDGTVRLWDTSTGLETRQVKYGRDGGPMGAVSFSPDGTRLAVTSSDTIVLFDAETWEELVTMSGHNAQIFNLAFSSDGTRLASAGRDRTLKVWDAATGQGILTLKGTVTGVSFSPDGTRLASQGGNTVKVWSAVESQEYLTSQRLKHGTQCASFSPDGMLLASAHDRSVTVCDTFTGQEITSIKVADRVNCLAFSPNGRRLASGGSGQIVTIRDATTLREKFKLNGHTDRVTSIAYSPDGTKLASASFDTTLRLWDAETGEELQTLTGHDKFVRDVVFSPDGTRLASACADKTVRLWDVESGLETFQFTGHNEGVFTAAFSPDGTHVASAVYTGRMFLWDATSGEIVQEFTGHNDTVLNISFSPDGRRMASASTDGTARLWDTKTGKETLVLKGFSPSLTDISFSPDGRRLVTADTTGDVKLWDTRPWTPKQKSQLQARSYLTVIRSRLQSVAELQAYIEDDQTISEEVRQQCLDWSELFWKNRKIAGK